MGINIPANSSLGSFSFNFFSIFFFFSAKMNLTVFAGILLAVNMATARRASLGEKTMQAVGENDEPEEAMREAARPASLVEKIMRAANEADEPDKAKRANGECIADKKSCDITRISMGKEKCCNGGCRYVNAIGFWLC